MSQGRFPNDFGKSIATVAIWFSVATCCFIAPDHAHQITGTAGVVTVLIWIFS